MKNGYKHFFLRIVGIIGITILSIIAFNFLNDEFCVFQKISQNEINKKKFWPNERLLKTRYILKNPDKYDSFIMGSSKVNKMNVSDLKGGNWYNDCLAMNTLDETLSLLKVFDTNGVKIKNIVLQMSDENFREREIGYFEYFDKNMIYARYPISPIEKIYCYGWYLLVIPDFSENKRDIYSQSCKDNVLKDGSCTYLPSEKYQVKLDGHNPEKFVNLPNADDVGKYNEYWKKPFSEIVKFCNERNIRLTVFITPETYDLYKTYDLKSAQKARKDLASFVSFYDFAGKNDVTENHDYFYDHYHFNEYTSLLIKDRIFNQKPQDKPKIKNFGTFIEKKSL